MRLVIDTNVVVSAFLSSTSVSSHALDHAQQHGDLLVSTATIEELIEVLSWRKFDRFVPRAIRSKLFSNYLDSAKRVEVSDQISACRDPRDDKFLSLAIAGHANFLVTGDADLLELHPFQEVAILSPAAYLACQSAV